jgi:hypothetical protein
LTFWKLTRDGAADRAGVNAGQLGRQKINNNSTATPSSARTQGAASVRTVACRPRYGTNDEPQTAPFHRVAH